ncbi:hypothetical protein P3L10_012998 [Capsicum annuum]
MILLKARALLFKFENNGFLFRYSSSTAARSPTTHFLVNYLINFLGFSNQEAVSSSAKKRAWLMTFNNHATMETNLNLLRSFGCSNDKIKNVVLRNPNILNTSTKKLDEMLHRVENEVGVSPDSSQFLHIINVLSGLRQETVDKKFEIFKSFWVV